MIVYEKEHVINGEENVTVKIDRSGVGCAEHKHEFFEFIYILKGSATHYINGTEYTVKHGDLLFIDQNQTHSYLDSPGTEFVNILIVPEFIGRELINTESLITLFRHATFEEFDGFDSFYSQRVHFSGEERDETDTVVKLILREYNEKNVGYKSVIQGGIRIIFSMMLRALQKKESCHVSEENPLIEEIKSYIDENFNKKITLSEIAEKCFYNPIYFGNMLKKHFGKSFSTYVKEKRIAKAAELLQTSERSVDEVMALAGYNDKKLFYAHFKEIYGHTPGAMRAESAETKGK